MLPTAADPLPHISPTITISDYAEAPSNLPMAQDPSDYPMAEDSPNHSPSGLSLFTKDLPMDFSINPDLYDSPIDQPPLSAFTSETSSALASESDLPSPSLPKATKQTDLLNFFSKMPSEEVHAKW